MKQHPFKIASLGMQHMLAMYAGAIIVPLIVGGGLGLNQKELTYLVSIDLLMCGVATIYKHYQIAFSVLDFQLYQVVHLQRLGR